MMSNIHWWICDYGDHLVLMANDSIIATFQGRRDAELVNREINIEIERPR